MTARSDSYLTEIPTFVGDIAHFPTWKLSSPVPEPSSGVLALLGLTAILFVSRLARA
ncbi:MAG: PEP-CTERM sorting domain-containing protein [Burkholderiales bacterium]|nr:PEP-CTERM sorting domain-containing protein [Burkholderiales bacterium]